jgi:uncharacterized lipoprotein YajG
MLRHNKTIQINFLLAIVFFAAGCAPSAPLAISLAVNKVPTVPLNIGAGTKVYLSVLDQRTAKILGYRAMVLRWQGLGIGKGFRHVDEGPISVSEDVEAVILKSLKDGLSSLGFETLVTAEPSAPTLEVAVQSLRYELFACCSEANFSGTITAKIYKDTRLLYEKTYDNYRADRYTHFRASDRSWFEENFNAALSYLIGQLLTDLELIKALREYPMLGMHVIPRN